MLDAVAALFKGNHEALAAITDEEADQFIAVLKRLIANLDRIVGTARFSQDAPP